MSRTVVLSFLQFVLLPQLFVYFVVIACIGNHMISSAIWDKAARVISFQRLTKLHGPVGSKICSL